MKRILTAMWLAMWLTGGARAEVVVTSEDLTLPYWTAKANWQVNPSHAKPLSPVKDTQKLEGERTLKTQVLENEYLRVQVVPELGGVVARAIHKPTGDDLFFWEGKLKNWLPWWESGVKMSFPYYEHGLGTEQPASWRVVRQADGSATLAMWMEFSRFNEPWQRKRYGRFSDMMFSEHVTLRPGEGSFSVTFRIVNPGPWKQGRRLWTDTLLPRNQTKEGVVQGTATPPATTRTEWVFPAAYASDHGGAQFGSVDPNLMKISNRQGGMYSVFAWNIPFGFAGLYYPEVEVNRLRLFDPKAAPGAKQWFIGEGGWKPEKPSHMYNFCELWGGTDNVFEGIENWIGPGESFQFTYRYTLIKGLGKVDYADERLAIDEELAAPTPTLKVVTLQPVKKLAVTLDGKALGEQESAPDRVAVFAAPAGTTGGRVVLTADGRVVFDRALPLAIPADTTGHAKIVEAIKGVHRPEMSGNADEQGNTYQRAMGMHPEGSTDKGRVLLRDGQLDAAIACLEQAVRSDAGEAGYLLGMALWEKGDSKGAATALEKAASAYAPARYYLAVMALGAGRPEAAREQLARLVVAAPAHWFGRVMLAYLDGVAPASGKGSVDGLMALAAEDPADPFVQRALLKAATVLGDTATARNAGAILRELEREPGAPARLAAFDALLNGQYPPPVRLGK